MCMIFITKYAFLIQLKEEELISLQILADGWCVKSKMKVIRSIS